MKRKTTAIICFFAMGILILDTKTALQGATEGIGLCLKTVIPSLFPFVVLSMLLTSSLMGANLPLLRPIGRLLRMPMGTESIWLTGSLGGYPVGAQSVGQAVKSGYLSHADAKRMLCFCSNAGPSFLFGIGMGILGDLRLCSLLWGIHILSSVAVGLLTPGDASHQVKISATATMTLPQALPKATTTMAMICGWVVLFRIFLNVLQKWILWRFSNTLQILLSGLMELSNGCVALPEVGSMPQRFIFFSAFLGFGGICVAMQTFSAVSGTGVDTGWYLPAKITQTACSILFSAIAAMLLFPAEPLIHPGWLLVCSIIPLCYRVFLGRNIGKKGLEIQPRVMYNQGRLHTR